MSADRAVYLDASAIVKLVVDEADSAALRRWLGRRRPLVTSALSRAEVARALLPLGAEAARRGGEVLARIETIRVSDRVLEAAGSLPPTTLRTLDAVHLATAAQLGPGLSHVVTYDGRMAEAGRALGFRVIAPSGA